ncbi:MAG: pseudouridine synthase [Anaeromyxobacteraceae bacterium]
MSAPERLQKYLAGAGVASRRHAEELITAGRVKVNGKTVTALGTKVEPGADLVEVDGRLVSRSEARAYYLLYKPSGCVTTASDPEGRPTAYDYLRGVRERVFPVGRLDWDAEGAVLFTDDGELANRLAHPRYGHRRVYLVKVKGEPEPEQLQRIRDGLRLEDGPAKALEIAVHEQAEKNTWIRVVVGEGRYHLVKRLCEGVGMQVLRLFRPEFGGVTVQGLRPGTFRALAPDELAAMRGAVGLGDGKARVPRAAELPKAARRHGHGPPAPPSAIPTTPDRPRKAPGDPRRERPTSGDPKRERPASGDPRRERPVRGGPGVERRDRPGRGAHAQGGRKPRGGPRSR